MYTYIDICTTGIGRTAHPGIHECPPLMLPSDGENKPVIQSQLRTGRTNNSVIYSQKKLFLDITMPKSCCAVNCHNHNMMKEKKLSFFTFPKDENRHKKWVQAVRRVNTDGSQWRPSKETVLCAEHFITGKPNQDPTHPDYVPSRFTYSTSTFKNDEKKIKRYNSAVKRKIAFSSPETPTPAKRPTIEHLPHINTESPVLQEMPQTPVTGLQKAVENTEREMLYDEVNNLRKEKQILKEENEKLKQQLDSVKLGSKAVEGNDDKCKFYTGLNWDAFVCLYEAVSPNIKPRPLNRQVSLMDQLFLVLLKLRLNIPFEFLAYHSNISSTSVADLFSEWIDIIYAKLNFLIKWQDREVMKVTLPGIFREKFPRLTSIIDCFEIFIERPGMLKARAECYSNYKKHSTVKVLISCSPTGAVNFLSCAWGGRVSDNEIVRKSGFIDHKYHFPGDQILADRGFTLQDDFASCCGAELIIPAFTKGKKQLSPQEVEVSRKISNIRIHIERVIGLIKQRYTILEGALPISSVKSLNEEADNVELSRVDKLIRTCAILVNFGEGIVYSEENTD